MAGVEREDLAQPVAHRLQQGEPVQAALLRRPRLMQLSEHLLER